METAKKSRLRKANLAHPSVDECINRIVGQILRRWPLDWRRASVRPKLKIEGHPQLAGLHDGQDASALMKALPPRDVHLKGEPSSDVGEYVEFKTKPRVAWRYVGANNASIHESVAMSAGVSSGPRLNRLWDLKRSPKTLTGGSRKKRLAV